MITLGFDYWKMTFINIKTSKVLYEARGYFETDETKCGNMRIRVRTNVYRDEYKYVFISKHEDIVYVVEKLEEQPEDPYYFEFNIYTTSQKLETDNESEKYCGVVKEKEKNDE